MCKVLILSNKLIKPISRWQNSKVLQINTTGNKKSANRGTLIELEFTSSFVISEAGVAQYGFLRIWFINGDTFQFRRLEDPGFKHVNVVYVTLGHWTHVFEQGLQLRCKYKSLVPDTKLIYDKTLKTVSVR